MAIVFIIVAIFIGVAFGRSGCDESRQTKSAATTNITSEDFDAISRRHTFQQITPIIGQEPCDAENGKVWIGYRNNSQRTFGYVGLVVSAYEPDQTKQLIKLNSSVSPSTTNTSFQSNAPFHHVSKPGDVVGRCVTMEFMEEKPEHIRYYATANAFEFIESVDFDQWRKDTLEERRQKESVPVPKAPTPAPGFGERDPLYREMNVELDRFSKTGILLSRRDYFIGVRVGFIIP